MKDDKANTIYEFFKEHGRFFRDKANQTYLLFREKLFKVSDNPEFNRLVTDLKLLTD